MKTLATVIALPALAGALALAGPNAQDELRPLAPSDHQLPAAPQDAAREGFDAAAWKARLRGPDLRERMGTFDALVRQARRDPAAYDQLRAWAEDERELELCWTAQLALRELQRGPAATPFGVRPMRPRAFGGSLFDPFAGFGRMDDLFDELRREMDTLRRGMAPAPPVPGGPGGPGAGSLFQRAQGFRFEQGPDGVRVEVTEDEDGHAVTRTYEAATLEELLEANPELREHFGPGGGMQLRFGPGPLGRLLDDDTPGADPFLARPPIPAPDGRPRQLGVMVRQSPDPEDARAGVPDGVGLWVTDVLPGSLAERMGVEPGDVLTELDGRALITVEDVSAALDARAADAPLVLEAVGPDGAVRTLRHTPERARPPGRDV